MPGYFLQPVRDESAGVQRSTFNDYVKKNATLNPFPSGVIALPEYASVEVVGKVKYRCLACPSEMPCHDTVVTCRWGNVNYREVNGGTE